MLPAPARIAAMPIPRSSGSWKPAVPPPPVGGAALGKGLGLELDVADGVGLGVRLGVGLGVRLGVGLGVALCDGLGDEDRELWGEALAELLGVAEALEPGDDVGSAPDDALPEQAETAMEASMARMPQLTAVHLVRRPVLEVAARPFTEPPHASGRSRIPFPGSASPKAPGAIKYNAIERTAAQWPVRHLNIRLRE